MTVTMPPAIDAWIVMMETTQLPQCTETFHNEQTGAYCALGLFCIANGEPPIVEDAGNWDFIRAHIKNCGLVIDRNDRRRMTFREIAAWARDHFKNPATWATTSGDVA